MADNAGLESEVTDDAVPFQSGENIELTPQVPAVSYHRTPYRHQDTGQFSVAPHQRQGTEQSTRPSQSQQGSAQSSEPTRQLVPEERVQVQGSPSTIQQLQSQSQSVTSDVSPAGSSARDSLHDDPCSVQDDVLKGVNRSISSALSDEGYLSQTLSVPSKSVIQVENVSDEDIEKYRQKFPKPLKVDYYDAMILYHEEDRQKVKGFLKRVNLEVKLNKVYKPRIALYDEILSDSPSITPVGELDFILDYCTYVLLYVTKDFCTDAWTEFSSQTCLMEAILNPERRWSVVPIFTESKRNASFRVPASVRSLKGIQYWSDDKFYVDSLRKLLEDKLDVRLKKEDNHKTKRKIWIVEEKGREFRVTELRQQAECHAKRLELSRMKEHNDSLQRREKTFQMALHEKEQIYKQVSIPSVNEMLKRFGDDGSATGRLESVQYFEYLQEQKGKMSQYNPSSQIPHQAFAAPASLSLLKDVGQTEAVHDRHYGTSFFPGNSDDLYYTSSAYPVLHSPTFGGSKLQGVCNPLQQDQCFRNIADLSSQGNQSLYSRSVGDSPQSHTPFFSHSGPTRTSDHQHFESSSSAQALGETQSLPDLTGGISDLSLDQEYNIKAEFQSMPVTFSAVHPSSFPTKFSPLEKNVTHIDQARTNHGQHLGQQGADHTSRAGGSEGHIEDNVSKDSLEKKDLVEDIPLGSQDYHMLHQQAGNKCKGPKYVSEAAEEPVLTAGGPAHHAGMRNRAEPASYRSGYQHHVIPRVPGHSFSPHSFPQRLPNLLSSQPASMHQGHGVYSPNLYSFPRAQARNMPRYQGEFWPQWQLPYHYSPYPSGYPEPPPPLVHHHYYHQNQATQQQPPVINIKSAENVMLASDMKVRMNMGSGDPGAFNVGQYEAEAFRNDSLQQHGVSYASEHCPESQASDERTIAASLNSRITQHMDQGITSSGLTDRVTVDRSQQSTYIYSENPTQYDVQLAYPDLLAAPPQPYDLQTSASSHLQPHALGAQQSRDILQWQQNYEQQQETDLKTYVADPISLEGARDT